MTEAKHFLQPELDLSEARFVKCFAIAGMVGGAALGLGTAGYEIFHGGLEGIEVAASTLLSFAVEVACIPTYLAARDRGRAAAAQLQSETTYSQ